MLSAPPQLIDAADGAGSMRAWPLHDAAATRSMERLAAAGLPPHALMQRAGLAVARTALALTPHARKVTVFAGPGNNGGDGFAAALALHRAGLQVQVHALGDPQRRPPDATQAFEDARLAGVPITNALPADAPDDDLLIDALLGLGATRAPQGELQAAIALANGSAAACKLAIDLPSGLNSDSGALLGQTAFRATDTLSLLTLKPGLFTAEGRDHVGRVWFDPIDVDSNEQAASARLNGPPAMPQRLHSDHKGRHGDVGVVAGAPGMAGAAVLAARAALAAGAGRVFLCLMDGGDAPPFDAACPELILRHRWWASSPAVLSRSTVVCGCGGGNNALREALSPLLSHAARLVLDADALNLIAADTAFAALLAARARRGLPTVLTPHPLEAARLLGRADAGAVQHDRLAAAATLAAQTGCTVVLKGSGTVIAQPGRVPVINPTGNARLASAGTGDVLAGWIGGLWSSLRVDAASVAAVAAWQHGAAAASAPGSGALTASALIDALAQRRL